MVSEFLVELLPLGNNPRETLDGGYHLHLPILDKWNRILISMRPVIEARVRILEDQTQVLEICDLGADNLGHCEQVKSSRCNVGIRGVSIYFFIQLLRPCISSGSTFTLLGSHTKFETLSRKISIAACSDEVRILEMIDTNA